MRFCYTAKLIGKLYQPLYLLTGKCILVVHVFAYTVPKIPTGMSLSSSSMTSNTGWPLLKSAAIVLVLTRNFDSGNNTNHVMVIRRVKNSYFFFGFNK